jgi:hypothetical protein
VIFCLNSILASFLSLQLKPKHFDVGPEPELLHLFIGLEVQALGLEEGQGGPLCLGEQGESGVGERVVCWMLDICTEDEVEERWEVAVGQKPGGILVDLVMREVQSL